MYLDDYDDGNELRFYGLGILMRIYISWYVHILIPYDSRLATLFDYLNINLYYWWYVVFYLMMMLFMIPWWLCLYTLK